MLSGRPPPGVPSSGGVGLKAYPLSRWSRSSRIRRGRACACDNSRVLGGEQLSRWDGAVDRVGQAGGRSMHRRQSEVVLGAVSFNPLSDMYGPCHLAASPLVSAWSWQLLGWAVFRRKSFEGSGLLARSRSHTSPKCQGQIRKEAQLNSCGWDQRTHGSGGLCRKGREDQGWLHTFGRTLNSCTQNMLRVKPNAIFLACTGVALAYCSCAADLQDKEAYRSWGGGSTVSAR